MTGEAGGDDDGDPDPKRDVMANDVLVSPLQLSSMASKLPLPLKLGNQLGITFTVKEAKHDMEWW